MPPFNICVVVPENNVYSETFIRAHIERLPGKVSFVYGGLFPSRKSNGDLLLPAPGFAEWVKRSLFSRLFKSNFDEEQLKKKAFRDFLKENSIDAVLAEYGPSGARVVDDCVQAGAACIVHFHGFDAYQYTTLEKFSEAYKHMFQKADAIIAVSRHMEKKLAELGAPLEKIHYSPCGMNAEIFHGSEPAKSRPIFLTAGRFVDKKGPHLVILAFSRVLAHCADAKLVMVGDGPLLDACKSLAAGLGISASVEFTGPKKPEELAQLMRQSRAFVQHSRVPSSGDSEGTPVAVQEAGGSGLPVVATLHAGIPDIVIDGVTGFLVPENDVAAMAEKMTLLAHDPGLAARMGKAAEERVLSNFTLVHSIARLNRAIEETVKNKSLRSNK